MYGYVRPVKDELLVKEYEDFKSAYCGLCACLKDRYGPLARFILNYDFTYIAMLLWDDETASRCKRFCPASPFKTKECCNRCPALERAADVSVILARHKLADNIKDGSLFKKLGTYPAYWKAGSWLKKAKRRIPDYAQIVDSRLSELDMLEKDNCDSIDNAADKFASCLAAAADGLYDKETDRIIKQILYHTGRVVYILDAFADLEEDASAKRYNAVAARYYLDGRIDENEKETLRVTINDSLSLMAADFELLPKQKFSPVLRNIITIGMPRTASLVLEGKYVPERRRELRS